MEEIVLQLINPTDDKLEFNVGGNAIINAYTPIILPTYWEWIEYTTTPLIPQDLNNFRVSGIEGILGSMLATNILDNTFAINAYVQSIDTSTNGIKYVLGLTDFKEFEILDKNNILEYCYFAAAIYYNNPTWDYLIYENQTLTYAETSLSLPPDVSIYSNGLSFIYFDNANASGIYTSLVDPNLVFNFAKGVRFVLQTFQTTNDIEIEHRLPINWNVTPSNQDEVNEYNSEGEKLSILARQIETTAIQLNSITIYQNQNDIQLLPIMELRTKNVNYETIEKINLVNKINPEQSHIQVSVELNSTILSGDTYIHFVSPPKSVNLIKLSIKKKHDCLLNLVKQAGIRQAKYYEQFDFDCEE